MNVRELSEYLKIKPSTLYAWASRRRIPHVRIHGLIRFRSEEIEAWLKDLQGGAPEVPLESPRSGVQDIDFLIDRAKREVYNPSCRKPRPKSAQRKEKSDGAV